MKKFLLTILMAIPLLMQAGNVSQYTFSKTLNGTNKVDINESGYGIKFTYTETGVKFYDGVQTSNSHTGTGFPFGFDFTFAGQKFDCAAISNDGRLILGRDGIVNYNAGGSNFTIGMSPIMYGVYGTSACVYHTLGDEGSHIFVLSMKNCKIADPGSSYKSVYYYQVRLFEATGKIEIAFTESVVYHSNPFMGFALGLHGWDNNDILYLSGNGINGDLSIAPSVPDMLNQSTYLIWNPDDYTSYYKMCFTFMPPLNTGAPAEAPADLTATQSGDAIKVSCRKAEGAAATAVLYSTTPFTDDDYPTDGETFAAGATFGNATALYYGSDDEINLTINDVDAAATYYIKAISVSGYPNYGRDNAAEAAVTTLQPAPSSLTATAAGIDAVALAWESDYPVIVAKTTEKLNGYEVGYVGRFGTPAVTAQPGDMIDGGGEIVYVGDAKSATAAVNPNELTYFRAWTVNGDRLSATATDAYGLPAPSLPCVPALENYPVGCQLAGWNADDQQFFATEREYYGDKALRAVSINGSEVTLTSPEFDLSQPVRVTFEYAMETVRPADENNVPMGNEPGIFGNGALTVSAGGTVHKSVSEYTGTMKTCPDGYESTSSTFVEVVAEIPAMEADGPITIGFTSETTSYIYLRNIRIETMAEVPAAPALAPTEAAATEDRYANLHFSCRKAEDADNTIVLFSESPITADCYPADGVIPAVGSKLDNSEVTVLYYGPDETVDVTTDYETVVADFETPYYFVALSASANPLYNRDNVAAVTYVTRGEMAAPALGQVTVSRGTLTVKATRHQHAETTLLLLSEGDFNGELVDGRNYNVGDVIGNATVIYHGNDADINHSVNLTARSVNYTVTAASGNSLWWHEDYATANVSVDTTTGVEEINAADLAKDAVLHTLAGIRVHGIPAPGIYIVNGVKTYVK